MKKSIQQLKKQNSWSSAEIRTLNRYHFHPLNKKKCTGCFRVFDKNTKHFDIHCKEKTGKFRLSGRCKQCLSLVRAKRKTKIRNNPESYCKSLITSIRHRAKKENLPFDISSEYLYNKLVEQDFKCYYTNEPIDLTAEASNRSRAHKNMGSVDKKTPREGYVVGNIVWTIWDTNRIKNNLTHDEFIKMCSLVTKNMRSK